MVVSDVDAGGDSRRSSYAAARRSSGTPLYRQSSNMSE